MLPSNMKKKQSEAVDFPGVDEDVVVDMPLDLSFKGIGTTEEVLADIKNIVFDIDESLDPNRTKINASVVKLNNNELQDIDGITNILKKPLLDYLCLSWIDLSFNQIKEIPVDLADLKGLKILYLHGNSITKLEHVGRLRTLQHLMKLTLHGNPIEAIPNYRQHVICNLTSLKMFDFSDITNNDRFKVMLFTREMAAKNAAANRSRF